MKRRLGTITKRKPIVQLDDVVKENFGLGFKKEVESEQTLKSDGDQVTHEYINVQADSGNAIKFVKSEPVIEDLDSKLNDFLKEINDLVEEGPTQKVAKISAEETTEPIPPTCPWQAVLDESTQCCYYWNMQTNQSTWEEPPEYTQYLVKYKEFEEEYTNSMKTKEQKKPGDKKSDKIEMTKTSSPSLVPYDCVDDDDEHNRSEEAVKEQTTISCEADGEKEEEIKNRISKKRSSETEEEEISSKRSKLATLFSLGQKEIKQHLQLMEEANILLESISRNLEICDGPMLIDGISIECIETSIQTRIEDWAAGFLPTRYLVSKLQECLTKVQGRSEQTKVTSEIKSSQNDDRDAVVGGDEVKEEEYTQPPLPTEEISAPPPPPEPAQPSVTRSLISMDYGEDSDDGANSEASTEPNLSRTSSPFPPLEDVEILLTPSENSNNSEAKIPTGSKKSKVLTAASISMRKKKVSKLVEKWQKIQEELEQ